MKFLNSVIQRTLLMARRRQIADGEPGLSGSLECNENGDLYVSFAPIPPPGGDPGNYVAVDLSETEYVIDDPAYAFPVASFLYGQRSTVSPEIEQVRILSADNAASLEQRGVIQTSKPGQWLSRVTAAENVLATVTRAASGAGTRHVVQGFEFTLSGAGNSPQDLICRIRNGAGGTILWESYIMKGVGGTSVTIAVSDISLPLSANTALVAEFSATAGAGTFQSINVRGVTVE